MYSTDPKTAVTHWLQEVVIGLNLCPFARRPFMADAVRIVTVESEQTAAILNNVQQELDYLTAHPEVETTIIVLTNALDDFFHYNDFMYVVDDWLWQNDYEGVYQIASFHPDYCFADEKANDVSNFTNRAPFPLLHILREDQLEDLLTRFADADEIPANNIRRLRQLSHEQLRTLFAYLIPRGHLQHQK